jgi:beta-hydroxyacyl-ACP dehydratase FabZ
MPALTIEDIMQYLPHRYPMLLVDRVVELDESKRWIVGIKNLTANEPWCQGHFPGQPIFPGVLQLEAMAQVGGILLIRLANMSPESTYFLLSVDRAKFRTIARPGDQLRIEIQINRMRSNSARFRGETYVGDQLVSEAQLMCMITEVEDDA